MATSSWVPSRTIALDCSQHEFCRLPIAPSSQRASSRKLVVLSATGFGRQTQTKSKPRILKELDFKSVDKTQTYKIYVRKSSEGEALTNWEELGVIVVEAGADIEIAVKERRSALAAAVNHQYPAFKIVGDGEVLQYGVKIQSDEERSEESSEQTEGSSVEGVESQDESPAAEAEEDEEISLVPDDDVPDVLVLDVNGKLPDESVAAVLRADDGKISGKRYKRRFF